eukprot:1136201-Pelagomonas_calceolata.AAC.3
MLRNLAHFRLHAHNLRIETSFWQEHTSYCDRRNSAHLFSDFPSTQTTFKDELDTFYFSQASSEDVFHSLQKQINETDHFIAGVMVIFVPPAQSSRTSSRRLG